MFMETLCLGNPLSVLPDCEEVQTLIGEHKAYPKRNAKRAAARKVICVMVDLDNLSAGMNISHSSSTPSFTSLVNRIKLLTVYLTTMRMTCSTRYMIPTTTSTQTQGSTQIARTSRTSGFASLAKFPWYHPSDESTTTQKNRC